jgi:uncharacterized protein YutE (UPF0331/DUF86 family)
MKYNGVISRKLDLISQRLSHLRSRSPLSSAQLEADYFFRSGIERTLQVCIEAMIDVANRIICLQNRPASTDSFSSLQQLEELGILEKAERYKNMIKFRNLIVHRYEQIETEILVSIVNTCLDDFDHFVTEIERHD